MRKYRHFLGALLTVVLLIGTVPAYAASSEALNGNSGKWSEFDQSLYDVTVSSSSFKSKNFEWPSSGSVLVRASGTNWSASDFSGITVPVGIVLDIYQYAGGSTDSYKLLVHVDFH